MPSTAHHEWVSNRLRSLNALETAHTLFGTKGVGLVFLRQQVVQGYVTQLSAQFQAFCRDLFSECLDFLVGQIGPAFASPAIRESFEYGRQLETKNPSPSALGTDFGRFGLNLWQTLKAADPKNADRNKELELLNHWRNAIAHQDFKKKELGGATTVTLARAKTWRVVCEELALELDKVMGDHLQLLLGVSP